MKDLLRKETKNIQKQKEHLRQQEVSKVSLIFVNAEVVTRTDCK